MHYISTTTKIIYDPEIYMAILTEIANISKTNSVDMYTIFLLNSIYMNEMLDEDLKWNDRTGNEYKEYVNKRVKMLIQIGVDLVKATNRTQSNVKLNEIQQSKNIKQYNSSTRVNEYDDCYDYDNIRQSINPFDNSQYISNNTNNKSNNAVNNIINNTTTNTAINTINSDYIQEDNIQSSSSSLFDLVDSMPVVRTEENDEYYKKVNKLNKGDDSNNEEKIIFS